MNATTWTKIGVLFIECFAEVSAMKKLLNLAAVLAMFLPSAALAQGDSIPFALPQNYGVGNYPVAIAAADFNVDGYPDLVTANQSSGDIYVLSNQADGTGSFNTINAVYPVPGVSLLTSVIATTIDNNTSYDIVVTDKSSDKVLIWLNNGDGTFPMSPVSYSCGDDPRAVCAVDVDNDNDMDIAVANFSMDSVSILKNTGNDPLFDPRYSVGCGDGPVGVVASQFDNDGDYDLAVVNQNSNTVSFVSNQGGGAFSSPVHYSVGSHPTSIALAELSGRPDLVVTNQSSDNVSVLDNNEDGTFDPAVNYSVGGAGADGPYSVICVDLDYQGGPDLAVANQAGDRVAVLKNSGGGGFGTPLHYLAGDGPGSIVAGNFDGGGSATDLAVANWESDNVSVLLNMNGCGDVNGNGMISLTDVTFLINYIMNGGPEPEPYSAGNADGCREDINWADLVRIAGYIFKMGPRPAGCDITDDCALNVPGNVITIGRPPYDHYPSGDSVKIPVHLSNTTALGGFFFALDVDVSESYRYAITSVSFAGSMLPYSSIQPQVKFYDGGTKLAVAWTFTDDSIPAQQAGLLFTLNADSLGATHPDWGMGLDTVSLEPAGDILLAPDTGGVIIPYVFFPEQLGVTNLDDSGLGSLRWAIETANSNSVLDQIGFAASGTIELETPLPPITADTTEILGFTAPSGEYSVVLDGGSLVAECNGLTVSAKLCKIEGLMITGFPGNGIAVIGGTSIRNLFTSNLIYDNGDLAIDLGGDGVTVNDPGDIDSGPNGLFNYPEIDSVTGYDGVFWIYGSGAPNSLIEVFLAGYADSTHLQDPSGHGEARELVGTDATDGVGTFSYQVAMPLPDYSVLSAVAIDPIGNTSEFCPNFVLVPGPLIVTAISTFIPKRIPPSVVNLWVTDPDGHFIGKDSHGNLSQTITDADYAEESPAYDDVVTINRPLIGEYVIEIIAEDGAEQGDMYTINVRIDGSEEVVLADEEDVPISGLPPDSLTYVVEEGWHYINGDANRSEFIDIDDIVFLIGYIFAGSIAPDPVSAGDADCSQFVDIDDVVYLINYVFASGPAPCQD
jgi:hypothetical protein